MYPVAMAATFFTLVSVRTKRGIWWANISTKLKLLPITLSQYSGVRVFAPPMVIPHGTETVEITSLM